MSAARRVWKNGNWLECHPPSGKVDTRACTRFSPFHYERRPCAKSHFNQVQIEPGCLPQAKNPINPVNLVKFRSRFHPSLFTLHPFVPLGAQASRLLIRSHIYLYSPVYENLLLLFNASQQGHEPAVCIIHRDKGDEQDA